MLFNAKDGMLLNLLTGSLLAEKGGKGKSRSFLFLVAISIVQAALNIIAEIALNISGLPVVKVGEGNMMRNMISLGLSLAAHSAGG